MKKITFLLMMLLVVTFSYSQTIIINENFDGATLPAGWDINAAANSGDHDWTFGSGEVPGIVEDFTTNAAIFDDDAAGNTGDHNIGWLFHDAVDVSSFTSLNLEYDYALNVAGNDETLSVGLWDVNNAWIIIRTYSVDTNPTSDSINISAVLAANSGIDPSNLYIGFGYDDNTSWAWGAGIDNVVLTGFLPPANDECANAIEVPVNALGTGCTTPTIANNVGATDSSPLNGTPTCGDFAGGDIWFTFTAPATGDIKIIIPEVGEWSSFATAVYIGGTCSNTPELACEVNFDISVPSEIPSEVTYTGLTPGDSYVLRAWDFGNDNFGNVSFCIEELSTVVAPANDECANAEVINDGDTITATTIGSTANEVIPVCDIAVGGGSCDFTSDGGGDYTEGVFYVYTSTTTETITISTANVGTNYDTELIVWSGVCGAFNCVGSDDDSGDGTSGENDSAICWLSTGSASNPVDYYIYVTGYSNDVGDFELTLVTDQSTANTQENNIAGLSLYPNPITDLLTIEAQEEITKLSIYNQIGQLVKTITPNQNNVSVNLENLATGVYMVKIEANNKVSSKKIIKK